MSERNGRSPIKRHGVPPQDQFVMIPNAIARDPELTSRGARILLLLLSHEDDWEVSQRSMAEQLRCKRTVIDGALDDLSEARYVAVTRYRTHTGQRAYEVYHVNPGGKFSDAEHAEYHMTVVLPAPDGDQGVALNGDQGVALDWDQPVALDRDHKENQVEDKEENQVENQGRSLCNADECSHPTIPGGRWCVAHLDYWKRELVGSGPSW